MQILELVLYGYNHKVRHLPFKLGQVNIITGRSKSGKSAVGDIIDYCLGGNSCNIADGVVRENVAWYGLLLQFEKERVFVARKNPDKGQQTTTTCYIEVGASLEVPEQCNFSPNTNVSGIEEALTRRIGISENLNTPPEGQSRLPLCSGTLEHPLPSVEMIKASIANLDKSISNVTREQPKLRSFISGLEQEREKKLEEIKGLQSEIDGIYQQEDERTRLRDINARRGKVIGRISLWIESVENDTESDKQEQIIKSIEDRIQEIDEILDADSVEDRKQSALSRIQENMTKWAKELELEHCDSPYRLDLNKVTVVVDKPDRPVPLKQLGSGSNWVGVHLIAYFALQYYFIGTNRPVPSFLFFDQPSQVYFPSELDEKNIDWNEVNKMYRFIVDRTSELEGKLQVIIVDHADLNNASFREYICENWWPIDKNLVPNDWYEKD